MWRKLVHLGLASGRPMYHNFRCTKELWYTMEYGVPHNSPCLDRDDRPLVDVAPARLVVLVAEPPAERVPLERGDRVLELIVRVELEPLLRPGPEKPRPSGFSEAALDGPAFRSLSGAFPESPWKYLPQSPSSAPPDSPFVSSLRNVSGRRSYIVFHMFLTLSRLSFRTLWRRPPVTSLRSPCGTLF